MKSIYDAIRKHFAHKPHGYREGHPQLEALAHIERTLRGFSNRLDTLTGAQPLKGKDLALQLKLREALVQTLRLLRTHQSRSSEAPNVGTYSGVARAPLPALEKVLATRDETGYLCTTALTLIRNACRFDTRGMHEDVTLYAELGPLSYAPGKLSFCAEIKLHLHGHAEPCTYQEGPFFLEGADLDTLGGATQAFDQIGTILWKCLAEAPRSARFKTAKAGIHLAEDSNQRRDERIRAAFEGLPAEDRHHLVSLSHRTPLSAYFA